MARLAEFLDLQNEQVFQPAGFRILHPIRNGLLHVRLAPEQSARFVYCSSLTLRTHVVHALRTQLEIERVPPTRTQPEL